MTIFDPTRFRLTPYPHQLLGVGKLLDHPFYGLFWKMRLGKTKAVIDAACVLYEAGLVTAVVVVCPAPVKDRVNRLLFTVTSLEYCRQENAQGEFPKVLHLTREVLKDDRVWLVNNEGSELGTHDSLQTKAMMTFRYSRCVSGGETRPHWRHFCRRRQSFGERPPLTVRMPQGFS